MSHWGCFRFCKNSVIFCGKALMNGKKCQRNTKITPRMQQKPHLNWSGQQRCTQLANSPTTVSLNTSLCENRLLSLAFWFCPRQAEKCCLYTHTRYCRALLAVGPDEGSSEGPRPELAPRPPPQAQTHMQRLVKGLFVCCCFFRRNTHFIPLWRIHRAQIT